ncbi:lipoprotein [uncultured Tateyamaria sp.]|uniref:lipoprotein n=1 Tax=Tateyamaria sp. 1078 TaxID=3417464 RepID=UPI00262EED6B|nr:lipoprotein [uncultured Tateyamaria sp.]
MKQIILALGIVVALAACESPISRATGPTGPELPPLGLAATAIWLEDREALTSQSAERAAEIRAAQQNAARRQAVVQPASQPAAQPLSAQPVPTGTIALAARAFADACVASLPTMQNVRAQARSANERYFGTKPEESSRTLLGGQGAQGDVALSVFIQAGRGRDINQCSVGARRQDASALAQALVATLGAAGYGLTPVADADAQRAWQIDGAAPGTILRVNSRRNFLGQIVTGAWISWR